MSAPDLAPLSQPPIIQASGLAIGHGGEPCARDIAFALVPGEIACLLGPNGCGKTTLFRTLLGLIPPLAGAIAVNGKPLQRMGRRDLAQTLAYVPQAHAPTFPYAVLEVVLMGRTARLGPLAQPSRADREIARDALARLGIHGLAGADYARLSGGQRQLVLIARALAQEAAAIVLDEPTASLDFGNAALVLSEIVKLAEGARGRRLAIVLSTHDPGQALAIGTRVLLLQRGGIVADGAPAAVLTAAALEAAYGVGVEVATLASGRRVCVPVLG